MSNQIETYIEVKLENRDQVSVLFRYILIVPVLIFAAAFAPGGAETFSFGIGMIVIPVLLAIVFRGVYPSYALRFNQALLELSTRITAYALLLNDNYPSIEANSSVRVVFPDVEGGKKTQSPSPVGEMVASNSAISRWIDLYDLCACYVGGWLVCGDFHKGNATSGCRGAFRRDEILESGHWLRVSTRDR